MTAEGFYLDRRYMLLKISDDFPPKPAAMVISTSPAMGLFETSISRGSEENFTITYHGSNMTSKNTINLPFVPSTNKLTSLERINIDMYHSSCLAYNMGTEYNEWFSERFGFKVVMAFWGDNPRPVLGNIPGKPTSYYPPEASTLMKTIKALPIVKDLIPNDVGIAFNDMAPYLIISETSISDVTARLGKPMDATKFRPNIIVKNAPTIYEEDFWAELTVNPSHPINNCKLQLTANCTRCASLNVDYAKGKFAEGKDGEVLKMLQKDRRVDKGMKYNPVFGRYGFVGREGVGKVLRIGDKVIVSRRNEERTTFSKYINVLHEYLILITLQAGRAITRGFAHRLNAICGLTRSM